tara:strand:- start:5046 stop:6995 length:1950 start_codon:yes stop_codon:yes gene_type:complete
MLGLRHSLRIAKKSTATAAAGGNFSGTPYSRSLYFDGTNDYIQASVGTGMTTSPSGQTVANFDPAWDLITDTGTTAYSISIDFRIHNAADDSSMFDIDINGSNGSGSVGTNFGGWRINLNMSGTAFLPRVWWYRATADNGNSNSTGGSFSYLHTILNNPQNNHFTDGGIKGVWNNLTITRGTSGNIDANNIVMYLNGISDTGAVGVYTPNFTTIPNQKWTDAQGRQIYMGHYGGDAAIGQVLIYNKELSSTEVNDLYDGGARAGGSADQTEILNQHPLGKSTANNIKGWWYLDVDGLNSDDDSGTTLQDKIGDCDFQLYNTTIADITSITTPRVPLFVASLPPASVYNGEATTFTQAGADSNSTVTWYSDSNRTSLVASGNTYAFTPGATGTNLNAYTKDVNSVSGVTQTGIFSYDVKNPGHVTHSYDAGAEGIDLISPNYASSDFTNGDFSMTFWQSQAAAQNSWGNILYMNNQNFISGHLNNSAYSFYITVGGTAKFFSVGGKNGTVNTWNCWMFTWDTTNGIFKIYVNGSLGSTHTDSALTTSLMAATSTLKTKIDDRWGKIANIGIYNDLLTDAEAQAICDDGLWGSSKDLEALSGSSSHLQAYYKIGNDTFNNNGSDHLNCEIDSSNDIPVANSNASSKSTDRP